ncbi:MAG: radical SAM protein, partial [Desulfosporosinus sp.]
MTMKFEEILEKGRREEISQEEAVYLCYETEEYTKAEALFRAARNVRDNEKGTVFKWSGGIASVLKCNLKPLCGYCPYWLKGSQEPLTIEEILQGVEYIEKQGIKEFHISAGTTLGSDGKEMVEIVEAIRSKGKSQAVIDVNCGAALSRESMI